MADRRVFLKHWMTRTQYDRLLDVSRAQRSQLHKAWAQIRKQTLRIQELESELELATFELLNLREEFKSRWGVDR